MLQPRPRLVADLAQARVVLRAHFGYPDFRPAQRPAVDAVLSGRDALVMLPTGGGKSLCYQVPALARPGLTVVVSPLISLMTDQVETLRRKGVDAAFLNSTLSRAEANARVARILEGSLRLLYCSPERLASPALLDLLRRVPVAMLAVDEAHCISEWGHEFRPAYRRLGACRRALGTPQTVALTATATPLVQRDIVQQLQLVTPALVTGGFDRTNLTYHVVPTRAAPDKRREALAWLRRAPGPAIVYAPTRTAVEQVAAALVRAHVRAAAYHGGLPSSMRQRAQDAFMQDRVQVMVATSAFGMDIDKPDVRLVVHHAMPGSLEAYYQEAGRAGRDGAASTCVLLHAPEDRRTHEHFLATTHPSRELVEQTWRVLRQHARPARVEPDDPPWLVCPLAPGELTTRLPRPLRHASVAAALRVLVTSGACRIVRPADSAVWLRLLATPDRIRRELTPAGCPERRLLRALWRAAGPALESGTSIDLARLFGGTGATRGLVPVLERLAAQQFVLWMRTAGGIAITPRWSDAPDPPVDWVALARRLRAERDRLDAMQQYTVIRDCRRAYVLRYFGDVEARATCGACDRCLAPSAMRRPPAHPTLP